MSLGVWLVVKGLNPPRSQLEWSRPTAGPPTATQQSNRRRHGLSAAQAARRLATRIGAEVVVTPGSHTAYHDHPDELAQAIRPFLRRVAFRA